MPLEYDGRSLVPNLDKAVSLALGIAEKREVKARDDETELLLNKLSEASSKAGHPLDDPENMKTFNRLTRVNPQAAQFALGVIERQDARETAAASNDALAAVDFFQTFVDTKDPKERSLLLTRTTKRFIDEGKDASPLFELAGMKPDQQVNTGRKRLLVATDAAMVFDQARARLQERAKAQAAQLELDERRQKMAIDAAAERRAQSESARGKETEVGAMRDDYTRLSAPFIGVRDAYARVRSSATNPSPAGDLGLIFNYVKMLDPTSTVRESEFAQAAQAGDFGDKIKAAVGKVQSGELLTPAMRSDFVSRSGELYKSQKAAHAALRKEYSGLAERRRFPVADVVTDFNVPGLDDPLPPGAGDPSAQVKQIGKFTVRVIGP